ncbi:single-strand DNA-binding protein [Granulicatella balaenopterae]|uniref:Single-stranded DNA-binding protein n=1 Tax=Granulicatella balaenopterae TaxID=137733 RepID=A0A1H9M7H5_9LACT|nr:single-stranded DNA-binding protein [Granulicatella balaenopterae]SER19427.1 single-strand DNA-binding protein [Granulicatella balaenopterae]
MNQVSLIGRVVRPIVLKDCNETVVMNNSLAINRFKRDSKNGGADFIPIVAWGAVAEQLYRYVEKGQKIGIVGHLQSRSYLNKQEQQVYVVEVVVEYVEFLEPLHKGDDLHKDEEFLRQFEIDSLEES